MHSGYKSHNGKNIPEHVDSDGSPFQNDNKNHRKKIVNVCIVCVSKSLSIFWTRHPGTHHIYIACCCVHFSSIWDRNVWFLFTVFPMCTHSHIRVFEAHNNITHIYIIYLFKIMCMYKIFGIVSLRASVLSPFRSSWTRTLLGGLWNVHNSFETCTTSMERAQLLWNVRAQLLWFI